MIHPTLKSDRVVMVDIDDTVVLWDFSETVGDEIYVKFKGNRIRLNKHRKNLNTIEKFYKLGYTLVAWSASGHEWAEAVIKVLGIEYQFSLIMSKPRYYFDDAPCETWMGPRIWRNPKTGVPD